MNKYAPLPREHYLDNLRWIAMLIGVFVHASTLEDFGVIDNITFVSSLFRMALFFLISGYLGALLLDKKGAFNFLVGRIYNLFIPLVTGTVLLNTLTLWLMFQYIDQKPSWTRVYAVFSGHEQLLDVHVVWHLHLWFLVSLMCFVCMAALIGQIVRRAALLVEKYLTQSYAAHRFAPVLVLVAGVGLSMTLIVIVKVVELVVGDLPWLVRITAQYAPFYVIGMMLFSSPKLFKRLRQTSYILGIFVLSSYFLVRQGDMENSGGVLHIATLIAVRFWVSFFVLDIGFRFLNKSNRFTALLSSSIYTVYIFHFFVLYVIGVTVFSIIQLNALMYWVLVATTIIVCLFMHYALIDRFSVLKLFFNGRMKKI